MKKLLAIVLLLILGIVGIQQVRAALVVPNEISSPAHSPAKSATWNPRTNATTATAATTRPWSQPSTGAAA